MAFNPEKGTGEHDCDKPYSFVAALQALYILLPEQRKWGSDDTTAVSESNAVGSLSGRLPLQIRVEAQATRDPDYPGILYRAWHFIPETLLELREQRENIHFFGFYFDISTSEGWVDVFSKEEVSLNDLEKLETNQDLDMSEKEPLMRIVFDQYEKSSQKEPLKLPIGLRSVLGALLVLGPEGIESVLRNDLLVGYYFDLDYPSRNIVDTLLERTDEGIFRVFDAGTKEGRERIERAIGRNPTVVIC